MPGLTGHPHANERPPIGVGGDGTLGQAKGDGSVMPGLTGHPHDDNRPSVGAEGDVKGPSVGAKGDSICYL